MKRNPIIRSAKTGVNKLVLSPVIVPYNITVIKPEIAAPKIYSS